MKATRSAGVIESSTTSSAMLTDSSSVTRSAGSGSLARRGPSSAPVGGSGSGTHSPTYRSRFTRAERSWSRQMRLTTVVSQAAGFSIAARWSVVRENQRAKPSWTASSASASDPSIR